jgi:hypothetical protein
MESSCKVAPKPKSIKEFFTTWYFWKPFLGVFGGLVAGYLYFHFVESGSGSWSFTNETYSSMFFGGLLGFFVTGSPCSRFGK